jgi:flagellar hook-length control protein FliK
MRVANAVTTDGPSKTPSNTKRDTQNIAGQDKVAGTPANVTAAAPLLIAQTIVAIAQPLTFGLVIPPVKLGANQRVEDSRGSREDTSSKPAKATTSDDSAPTAANATDDPRQAAGTQETALQLDFSIVSDARAAGTPGQPTGEMPASSSAMSTAVAPMAPPALPATMPAADKASGAGTLTVTPKASVASQLKATTPSDSSQPVKPTEHENQAAKTNSSSRSNANGDQTSNNSQDASGSSATATAKSAVSFTASVQTAPQATSNHNHSAAANGADSGAHATAGHSDAAAAAEATPNVPAQGLNTAKLIQSLGQTEMRVGLRSAEFGEVSIRSSISQQQVVAQISAAHGELARAISDHLPSLQAKLDHYGVQATVEVSQSGMSFGSERDRSSAQDQKPSNTVFQGDAAVQGIEQEHSATRMDYTLDDGRIDIRA